MMVANFHTTNIVRFKETNMRELSMNEINYVSGANAAQVFARIAIGTALAVGAIATAATPYPTYYYPSYNYPAYNYPAYAYPSYGYNYGYPYSTTDVIVYDYGYPGYSVTYVY